MGDLVHDAGAVVADVAQIEGHAAAAAGRLVGAAVTESAAGTVAAVGASMRAVYAPDSVGHSIGHDISHIAHSLHEAAGTVGSSGVDDLSAAWHHFTDGGSHHNPAAPHVPKTLPIDP